MLFTQHIVIDIVCRRNFKAARTKLDVHIVVFDDGDDTVYQRHDDFLAAQPLVLGVIRVDTHGRIPHNRFGARSSHDRITAIFAFDFIAEIIQFTMLFLVNHLFIGEGGQCFRVPIDHSHPAINQTLVIEIDKDPDNACAARIVHRKGCTIPVARRTEFSQLLEDNSSVLISPGPGMFQELFARKIRLLDTFFGQFVHYLSLRSNRRMIRARNPAGILAFHSGTADKDILNRVVKHVSHVKDTRNIRGRDDDGVRFTSVGFRTK